jgi:hypothetical protein
MGEAEKLSNGQGGSNLPLPDSVTSTDALVRFVDFIVNRGYKSWKLEPYTLEKWKQPTLVNNVWVLGPEAIKHHWSMAIMSLIVHYFPSNFKTIASTKLTRDAAEEGACVLTKPIKIGDLMRCLEHGGLVSKAGEKHA